MNNNYYNAAIATFCAELVTIPISTIKTNYQIRSEPKYFEVIKIIYQHGGIKRFFNASGYAITSQILTSTFKFGFYREIQKIRNTQRNDFFNNMLNGIVSGNLASIITHPLEVNKVLKQQGISFQNEFNNYGFKLLVRGYSKGFAKTTLGSAIFYPIYDKIKNSSYDGHNLSAFSSGLLTAIISTTILHPIDYLKVKHMSGIPVWKDFNIKTIYRGYLINMTRIVPHFSITMFVIDYLQKLKY